MAEIINELSELIASEAKTLPLESAQVEKFTQNLVNTLHHHFGGIPIYIPKSPDNKSRNALIYSKFTGKNQAELCREFGMSYQNVCRIIQLQRRKQKIA